MISNMNYRILALFFLFAGFVNAAVLETTADVSYTSRYVFRGVQSSGKSFQPSINFDVGDLSLGVWANKPLDRDESREVDFTSSYSKRVGVANLSLVAAYYRYPDENNGTFEPGVGITIPEMILAPSLFYYHDLDLRTNTVQGGVSISKDVKKLNITTGLNAGTVHGAMRYDYMGADVGLSYPVWKATANLGVHYSNTRKLEENQKNTWFSAGLSLKF